MWNYEKIEQSRVRLIAEKIGVFDKEIGLLYERVIWKGDYYYFQTVVKEPHFVLLSSFPLPLTSAPSSPPEHEVLMCSDPKAGGR